MATCKRVDLARMAQDFARLIRRTNATYLTPGAPNYTRRTLLMILRRPTESSLASVAQALQPK